MILINHGNITDLKKKKEVQQWADSRCILILRRSDDILLVCMNKGHIVRENDSLGILFHQLPTYLFFIELIACLHIFVLTPLYQPSTNLARSITEQTIERQNKYTQMWTDVLLNV